MMIDNIAAITDAMAEKYIELNELEARIHTDVAFHPAFLYGNRALAEAKRLQQEFFPLSDNSEEIIARLLNQKFWYDSVDYSDEVEDKGIIQYCEVGLFLYTINALSDEVQRINKIISDLEGTDTF